MGDTLEFNVILGTKILLLKSDKLFMNFEITKNEQYSNFHKNEITKNNLL